MTTTNALGYLLVYAARIDANMSQTEAQLIASKLGNPSLYIPLIAEFEQDDEYTRLQKVEAILSQYTSAERKAQLVEEIKALFVVDNDFSGVEGYLMRLIGRINNK